MEERPHFRKSGLDKQGRRREERKGGETLSPFLTEIMQILSTLLLLVRHQEVNSHSFPYSRKAQPRKNRKIRDVVGPSSAGLYGRQ